MAGAKIGYAKSNERGMEAEAKSTGRWWHVSSKTRDTLQVVLALGMLALASLAWLDGRIDRVEDSLDRRIDRVEDSLNGRMDRLGDRMDRLDGRMDRLDGRMDRLENRMNEGFRSVNAKLDALMLALARPGAFPAEEGNPPISQPAGSR